MALTNCEDCGKQVSSAAPACPHCGRPNSLAAPTINGDFDQSIGASAALSQSRNGRPAPVFLAISAVCLLMTLGVPRLLLIMPTMITIVCALVSLFRNERYRGWSVLVLLLSALLYIGNAVDMSRTFSGTGGFGSTENLDKASIVSFNWSVDPTFAGRGTVKWNVTVRNLTDRPMSMVGVQLTTKDKSAKVITTTTTFVSAIPPHDTRSEDSYADYYGNEDTASTVIESVRFADQ